MEVLQLQKYGPKMVVSPEHAEKIVHAMVKLDGNMVMLADCFEGSKLQQHPLLGLFMNYTDYKKAENTYNILTKDGKIERPLQKNNFGGF